MYLSAQFIYFLDLSLYLGSSEKGVCVRGVHGVCSLGEKGEAVVTGEVRFLGSVSHVRHQAVRFHIYYTLTATQAW